MDKPIRGKRTLLYVRLPHSHTLTGRRTTDHHGHHKEAGHNRSRAQQRHGLRAQQKGRAQQSAKNALTYCPAEDCGQLPIDLALLARYTCDFYEFVYFVHARHLFF